MELSAGLAWVRVEQHTMSYTAATSACEKGCDWFRAVGLLVVVTDDRMVKNNFKYSAAVLHLMVAAWGVTQQPFQQQQPFLSQQQLLSQQLTRRGVFTCNAAVGGVLAHCRMRRYSITYSAAVWWVVVLLARCVWMKVLWILQAGKWLQQAVAIFVAALDVAPVSLAFAAWCGFSACARHAQWKFSLLLGAGLRLRMAAAAAAAAAGMACGRAMQGATLFHAAFCACENALAWFRAVVCLALMAVAFGSCRSCCLGLDGALECHQDGARPMP